MKASPNRCEGQARPSTPDSREMGGTLGDPAVEGGPTRTWIPVGRPARAGSPGESGPSTFLTAKIPKRGIRSNAAVDLIVFLTRNVRSCFMFVVGGTSALTPALSPGERIPPNHISCFWPLNPNRHNLLLINVVVFGFMGRESVRLRARRADAPDGRRIIVA